MNGSSEALMLKELKRISRLLALSLIEGKHLQSEKIEKLDSYGFSQKEIAELLAITPNIVSATLSSIRKKAKSTKDKKASKPG